MMEKIYKLSGKILIALFALFFLGACSSSTNYTKFPSKYSKNKRIMRSSSVKLDRHSRPVPKIFIIDNRKYRPVVTDGVMRKGKVNQINFLSSF